MASFRIIPGIMMNNKYMEKDFMAEENTNINSNTDITGDSNISENTEIISNPDIIIEGLTTAQVQEKVEEGKVNDIPSSSDVTLAGIIRENLFTYFNLIFLLITICLCLVGSFRNLTFLPVIIANIMIGIVQEWRSKSLLDRLAIMTEPKADVLRDGTRTQIASDELVEGDVVYFSSGHQVPADGCVLEGELMVNESLLTGEAELILKTAGSQLLSGSFVVSGTGCARLTKVGAESYSAKLTAKAKAFDKKENSEMIRSLDRLVRIVGIAIIPLAGLLFWQQHYVNHIEIRGAVTGTVAAIIGMIPEGLYLLASVAMAVSAMRLAMSKVLVHNMKSIETLARADVLCIDKTGTITENSMSVKDLVLLSPDNCIDKDELELVVGDFAACMSSDNATIRAIKERFTRKSGRRPEKIVPFSSEYKFSGASFSDKTYVMGAPEFILREDYPIYAGEVEPFTTYGYRVLMFAEYDGVIERKPLTGKAVPIGMIILMNPVRANAPETFRYFAEQGVAIKVISGDNPLTVSEVARQAGIEGADKFVDASSLTDEELKEACESFVVFGRVRPDQKQLLVKTLKNNGHTVAMTGDGVNDVLALKDADCSIAMASGSDAAAHTAQMVLLDSDFARMPYVVSEGRRVVNNIERTASLFLVKNIFSLCMSLFSILLAVKYPLEPSQVSLISMFTIGIPAFFLSLESNHDRISGHFLTNVFLKALAAGLTDFIVISALVIFCQEFRVRGADLSTSCTILLAVVGIMILHRIMSPMTKTHWIIWFAMIFGILFSMTFLDRIFAISSLSRKCAMLLIVFAILTEPVLRYLSLLTDVLRDLFTKIKAQIKDRQLAQEKLFADIK